MGEGAPATQTTVAGDLAVDHRPDQVTCDGAPPQGGKIVELGGIFIKTIRHFWPELNQWAEQLSDSRSQPFVTYDRKFLLWWGVLLFGCKLGSRRQLDYELRDMETQVLGNLNRLSGCHQDSLPVNKTLDHYLQHSRSEDIAALRTHCIRRLIRMKALDDCRLNGMFVVALDGTGYLTFGYEHCSRCLTQVHNDTTRYFHPVLEAKIVHVCGLALSIGTEFIENPAPDEVDRGSTRRTVDDYEKIKQDCELKAFLRLAPTLKKDFPQTPLCICADSLHACGTAMQTCKNNGWSFVLVFKPGRTPALWEEFQGLLTLVPQNTRRVTLPDGTTQDYRWVNAMSYTDSENRTHIVDAIICQETCKGETTTFSWVTDRHVTANNVVEISTKGGRVRSKIENQGFNIQKNNGLNLEHAYSIGTDTMKSFYYLMQIAHLILQMVEMGSLLKNLAVRYKTVPLKLFGSLRNIARRLLECLRNKVIPDVVFDTNAAASIQIRLNTG